MEDEKKKRVKTKKPKIQILPLEDPKESNTKESNTKESNTKESNTFLQLGDLIRLHAPQDKRLESQSPFWIDFLSSRKIRLVPSEKGKEASVVLYLDEAGHFINKSIKSIDLLYRNPEAGFARQNGLLPGQWINVFFDGDTPQIVTAQITNLEEDMIEIKTFPDDDILYVNFAYQGLIGISLIELRDPPEEAKGEGEGEEAKGEGEEVKEGDIEENSVNVEENAVTNEYEQEEKASVQKGRLILANEIYFGAEMAPVQQTVAVSASEQRYNVNVQTQDLMDNLLSQLSVSQRTQDNLNLIHLQVQRFLELRTLFSVSDVYGNVTSAKIRGSQWKPLTDVSLLASNPLAWFLPVVKNRKILFDKGTLEDEDQDTGIEYVDLSLNLEQITECFQRYASPEEQNRYMTLFQSLAPLQKPFVSLNTDSLRDVLVSIKTQTDLPAVLDNDDRLYSTTDSKTPQRFVMDRYTTGLTHLESQRTSGSKLFARREQMTESDLLEITSLLVLPEPVVRFSKIALPKTSILERAQYNLDYLPYSSFLLPSTDVDVTMVDEDTVASPSFASNNKIQEYSKSPMNRMDLAFFMDHMIPTTLALFDSHKNKIAIERSLSLVSVIDTLEPFRIYPHDIHVDQQRDMQLFVNDKCKEYIQRHVRRGHKMMQFKKFSETMSLAKNHLKLSQLLPPKSPIADDIHRVYDGLLVDTSSMTNTEWLYMMTEFDYGVTFQAALSLQNVHLMLPENISQMLLEKEEEILSGTNEKVKKKGDNNNTCQTYVIAKRYKSKEELMEDNGKESLYFDRAFDKTPYDLLNEEKEKETKTEAEWARHLEEKKGLTPKEAAYMAESLIHGMKRVVEGDLAIVQSKREEIEEMQYFRRVKNRWEPDTTIPKNTYVDSQDTLCQFQQQCIQVETEYRQTCEPLKKEMTQEALQKLVREFDERYAVSKEEMERRIHRQLDYALSTADKRKQMNRNQWFQYDKEKYNLGLSFTVQGSPVSPFQTLRDMILSQADFIKKQTDLVQFAVRFTREAMEKESVFWRYCIRTEVPLLPSFLYELAAAYAEQGKQDTYLRAVEDVIKRQGALSDDGDAWVDKHSGYVIRRIDYSTDEGYDEAGFRVISRGEIEEDAGESLLLKRESVVVPLTGESKLAASVFQVLGEFMGVPVDLEAWLPLFHTILVSVLPKEADYRTRMEQQQQKQGKTKKMPEYQEIYESFVLFVALGVFLVGVQTTIPRVRTKKTFPGCVRSWEGYPLEGAGDLSALNYVACVAEKISKSTVPWTAIKNKKQDFIATKLKSLIDASFLTNPEVTRRIREALDYLLQEPENKNIPKEHRVELWKQFLPPLGPIGLKQPVSMVSSEFKKSLKSEMTMGSPDQWSKLNVMRGKVILFSLSLQEQIQSIVKKKSLLLANALHEPFLENACCYTSAGLVQSALDFFQKENGDIGECNDRVHELMNLFRDIADVVRAAYLFSRADTKTKYPVLNSEFSETTVFLAFVRYCGFLSFSEDLKTLCRGDKPILRTELAAERVRKWKQEGRTYTHEQFMRLLQIVGRNNVVSTGVIQDSLVLPPGVEFGQTLDRMEGVQGRLRVLVEHLVKANAFQEEETLRSLRNFLATSNAGLRDEIFEFINVYGSQTKKAKRRIQSVLNEKWNTGVTAQIAFVKTYMKAFVSVFPEMIQNRVNYQETMVPGYWRLSSHHAGDLQKAVAEYYVRLRPFYDMDVLSLWLNDREEELLQLAAVTPTLDERTMSLLLDQYLFLTLVGLLDKAKKEANVVLPKIEDDMDVLEANTVEHFFDEGNRVDFVSSEVDDIVGSAQGGFADNLRRTVADLIGVYVDIMGDHKSKMDLTVDKIDDIVYRSKEREKDTFTDRLKALTDEERKADTILKINKLGVWSKGLHKGLTTYVKETYDEERALGEVLTGMERQLRERNKDVNAGNVDIFMEEALEQADVDLAIQQEVDDISQYAGYDNDDDDGAYDDTGDNYYND